MRSHLVATWAIVSCLFALIIHILFEIPAPNEWFDPEWEAGDLLTYASTVALGLLAIWQNQKFKEESDKAQELMDKQNAEAQERMEKLTQQANELSVVSKIIEAETERIKQTNLALDTFYSYCDYQKIGSLYVGFRVMRVDSSNMTEVYYSADEYSQDLLSSMESNIKTDRTELDLLFGCLLEWGLSLSEKFAMFQIDGINVYAYGMTAEEYHDYKDRMVTYQDGIQVIDCQPEKLNAPLIACFAENVPEAVIKRIAKMQPLRAVFRDSCFADSPSKINVYRILRNHRQDRFKTNAGIYLLMVFVFRS